MNEPVWYPPVDLIFIQSRAEMDFDLVKEYAAMLKQGVEFDPCQGIEDEADGRIYVWDGAHRGEAAKQAGLALLVEVRPGSQTEAEWLSFSANARHGLRRTNKDIARVVKTALCHIKGTGLSNREIARHCGVHHSTVDKYRKELELSGGISQIEYRTILRKGTTYEMRVKSSGKVRQIAPEDVPGPEDMPPPVCAFCKQETPIYEPDSLGVGICSECAKKALLSFDEEQLEFGFYTEDRTKLVEAGFRVFRVDWTRKQLREFRPALNGRGYSWQLYSDEYETKAALKREMTTLAKDDRTIFENH